MTYREAYEAGMKQLQGAGIEEAGLEARLLLEYVCHTSRQDLLAHGDREVTAEDSGRYAELIGKRRSHVPLQYLTGEQEFMGLPFLVNRDVLIPRQDTEILAEEAMRVLHDGMRILDLCTGSGCILLSLLRYSIGCSGVGVDISKGALAVAEENARRLGLDSAIFEEMDIMAETDGTEGMDRLTGMGMTEKGSLFDIVVSNPPYIESGVIPGLMEEVRSHEPKEALDGGPDGLAFYRRIAAGAGRLMCREGHIFLEIGCGQAEAVEGLLRENGFEGIGTVKDYAGLDRVVHGIWMGRRDFVRFGGYNVR